MVRLVRFGRRDALPPARNGARWAGPPPLLLLFTVLGFLVAPLVDDDEPAAPPAALTTVSAPVVSPRSVEPQLVRRQVLPGPVRGGTASAGIRPVRLKPVDVGVASMNMFRQLSSAQATQDARALTGQDDHRRRRVAGGLPVRGECCTRCPAGTPRPSRSAKRTTELAVSWRSDEFRLIRARQVRLADGRERASRGATRSPTGWSRS